MRRQHIQPVLADSILPLNLRRRRKPLCLRQDAKESKMKRFTTPIIIKGADHPPPLSPGRAHPLARGRAKPGPPRPLPPRAFGAPPPGTQRDMAGGEKPPPRRGEDGGQRL